MSDDSFDLKLHAHIHHQRRTQDLNRGRFAQRRSDVGWPQSFEHDQRYIEADVAAQKKVVDFK